MRRAIQRYKLAPERMAEMAAGIGRYSKLSPKFQHQVTMDMLAYAYGKPAQIIYNDIDAEVTVVKRVIGVDESQI
jgi:hypothetical protein